MSWKFVHFPSLHSKKKREREKEKKKRKKKGKKKERKHFTWQNSTALC